MISIGFMILSAIVWGILRAFAPGWYLKTTRANLRFASLLSCRVSGAVWIVIGLFGAVEFAMLWSAIADCRDRLR